jgi:hypothetical protein
MAIKKPAKPKFKKLPKQPKASASPEAWRNYENRVKAVNAENDKKVADYKKAVSAYEAEQRKRDSIKNMVAKSKAKLSGLK